VKLLVVASSLDLRAPFSATPSWWQLLKALAEQGVQLTVAPYHGPAIESPWWTAAANPCEREGDLVARAKRLLARGSRHTAAGETLADRAQRHLANAITRPIWLRHLRDLLERESDLAGVLFLTVPPNHFVGVPTDLRRRFGVPTFFYDGDVPASLPRHAGFRSGFKIYQGANLSEFEAVISNSAGGVDNLRKLGARRVHVLYYAADPTILRRAAVPEDVDVFFFGNGAEYREHWLDQMIAGPSRAMPEARFAVRGDGLGNVGCASRVPRVGFSGLRVICSRSRVNVMVTRAPHATVHASSTARPFELAALGCAMVTNPYAGVEEWFAPGREILVVHNQSEAIDTYRCLLREPGARRELGERAHHRLLHEHTYAHRANQLVAMLSGRHPDSV
jgi:hypothetical protein